MARQLFSAATFALLQAGITQAEVARHLDLSRQAVSRMLAGTLRPHPALFEVIEQLASKDVAKQVAQAVGAAA